MNRGMSPERKPVPSSQRANLKIVHDWAKPLFLHYLLGGSAAVLAGMVQHGVVCRMTRCICLSAMQLQCAWLQRCCQHVVLCDEAIMVDEDEQADTRVYWPVDG